MTEVLMVTKHPAPREKDAPPGMTVYRSTPPDGKKPLHGVKVSFSGFAPDDLTVASLVATLSQCSLFEQVRIHSSRGVERFGYEGRKFRVTMWVPLDREFRPLSAKDEEMAHAR
jgi:hypothetical protein